MLVFVSTIMRLGRDKAISVKDFEKARPNWAHNTVDISKVRRTFEGCGMRPGNWKQ